MGTGFSPAHLLLFGEASAHHLIDGRLYEGGREDFSLPGALAVISELLIRPGWRSADEEMG